MKTVNSVRDALSHILARLRPSNLRRSRSTLVELAEFPDLNPGPVVRLDNRGFVLRANETAGSLFGDEHLVGRCWLDVCPEMASELWRRILAEPDPLIHETNVGDRCLVFTHVHRPGSEFVFVYGADITARRRAEEQLAQQARELAEMGRFPEMNPGPVCRLDREGIVILANRAARKLFGEEGTLGHRWLDICPGMDRSMWDRLLRATHVVVHETQIGDRSLVFTHTPGASGGEIFVYGADVTELRLTERALRQSEKMATLGTLAAGVAHELNNPGAAAQRAAKQLQDAFSELQAAQLELGQLSFSDAEQKTLTELDNLARNRAAESTNLDALNRSDREVDVESWLEDHGIQDGWSLAPGLVSLGMDSGPLEKLLSEFGQKRLEPVVMWLSRTCPVYSLLEEIRHGTSRLAEIVAALKAYSFVGQGPVHAVDVNEGLRNTLIILRNKIKRGITVEQNLVSDLPRIQGYGSELNQVWTNLIDNAAEVLEGKGLITLRTFRENDWVVVEIEDNGPGIPKEIQPRIFDPFFTTKAPGEGTGLGLNTSYNIVVQKHRGTITVDSQPGRTLFVVKLPIDLEGKPLQPESGTGEILKND